MRIRLFKKAALRVRAAAHLLVFASVLAAASNQLAFAQLPELSGVSDFLSGFWKNRDRETTQILLHNPTAVLRDVVVLYYDDKEVFHNCQVLRLTPHDFEILPLIFSGIAPSFNQAGKYGPPGAGPGVVEIRSAPVTPEDPNHPGGLTGYVQVGKGNAPTQVSSGQTYALAPLFPIDVRLFNIKAKNPKDITTCVCEKLMSKGLKSDLLTLFCAVP